LFRKIYNFTYSDGPPAQWKQDLSAGGKAAGEWRWPHPPYPSSADAEYGRSWISASPQCLIGMLWGSLYLYSIHIT